MGRKKASAKRRQRALAAARKDGRVSGAEAKKLRGLGVSKNKITNTKKATVSKAAVRQAAKPKPQAAQKATSASTRKDQTSTRSNQTSSVSRNNGTGGSKPNYESAGSQKDTGNKFLSGKQANQLTKLLNDPVRFEGQTTERTDDNGDTVTSTTPGKINFEALSENRLVQKGLRGLSASGKNINNFSSNNDLQKLLGYAKPLASKPSDNGLGQFGARASGNIKDIREQLGIDRQTALSIRDSFDKKKIETTDPKYQRLLDKIGKGLDSGKGKFAVPQLNRTFLGADEGDLDVVNTNRYKRQLNNQNNKVKDGYTDINKSFDPVDITSILDDLGITGPTDRPNINDDLTTSTNIYGTDTAEVNTDYQTLIDGLTLQNKTLGDIADGFSATNNYLTSELSTANAAVEEANRRTNNLKTAFTPGANPNAMSILAGDYRKSRRRREDNALSDLSILTDLGSNKNQLSGLQLA